MVYLGKPSRACQVCKNRRIKCDEARPTCGQCKKSNRECPGYQDEFDLVFRDENKALARRAKRAAKVASQPSPVPSSSSSVSPSASPSLSPSSSTASSIELFDIESSIRGQGSLSSANEPAWQIPSFTTSADHNLFTYLNGTIPTPIKPDAETVAVASFFRNFVRYPKENETMRGFLEHLTPIYNLASADSPLHLATTAIALVIFNNYPYTKQLIPQASAKYGQALQRLNDVLKDPVRAKSDETLLTVLLFSVYEAMLSMDGLSAGWAHHVDGAIALAKLRGKKQFRNPTSYNIFRAVRSMMVTRSIQRSEPIDDFPSPNGWAGQQNSQENAANRLTVISLELPAMRVRMKSLLESDQSQSNVIRTEAQQLLTTAKTADQNLSEWFSTIPDSWAYINAYTVQDDPLDLMSAEAWPGPQHVYTDVAVASIINDYRLCRLFCNQVILACTTFLLSDLEEDYEPQVERELAQFTIQHMVDDICSSVPFHSQYIMYASQLGEQEARGAAALGNYLMAVPISVASQAQSIPKNQRVWLYGRLTSIACQFGLAPEQVPRLAQCHVLSCSPVFPWEAFSPSSHNPAAIAPPTDFPSI